MSTLDIEMGGTSSTPAAAAPAPAIKKTKKKPLCANCHETEAVKKPKRAVVKTPRDTKNFEKCRLNREFTRNFEKLQDLMKRFALEDFYQEHKSATSVEIKRGWFTDSEVEKAQDQIELLLKQGVEKYTHIKERSLKRRHKEDKKAAPEKFHLVSFYKEDFDFIQNLPLLKWDHLDEEEEEEVAPPVVEGGEEEEEAGEDNDVEDEEEEDDEEEEVASKLFLNSTPPSTPAAVAVEVPEAPKPKKRKTKHSS